MEIDVDAYPWRGAHVVVLGDIVADQYLYGEPERVSREAPVLILRREDLVTKPGGAANVAANLRALGARVSLVGTIGDDWIERALWIALVGYDISTSNLVVDSTHATTSKMRVIGRGGQGREQQVVRIDQIDMRPHDDIVEKNVLDGLQTALRDADMLMIADYDCGMLSPFVLQQTMVLAAESNVPVIVDSHGGLHRFRNALALTPNQPELESYVKAKLTGAQVRDAALRLGGAVHARYVLVTQGSMGLTLVDVHNQETTQIPAYRNGVQEVVDPNGAGDTVAAVFALGCISGMSARDAACLANIAGGIVVLKAGPATVTFPTLWEAAGLDWQQRIVWS